ncbi:MAG: TIM44-like domain-containing protein [Gammaproteobacteria bacterium]|nr:TIM44-like domain-containing protein [Gammaproteobacteria bacterium]
MEMVKKIVSLVLIMSLLLPLLAEARAGSRPGGGGGYRSSRSYQGGGGYNYRPRSDYRSSPYTPRPATAYPAAAARSSSGSFLSGLASGVLGVWLYNKIFQPNTPQKTEATTPTSQEQQAPAQGGFLRTVLILLGAYLVWRLFRNRRRKNQDSNFRTNPDQEGSSPRKMDIKDFLNLSKGSTPLAGSLTEQDQQSFETLLQRIQNAWSQYDISELQRLTTPEMLQNFSEIIRENQERNIKNYISQVKLLKQEVLDSWQEGADSMARVAMTWSAVDYAVDSQSPDTLLDGDRTEPTVATEIWTFKKSDNGSWLLAEIQQV